MSTNMKVQTLTCPTCLLLWWKLLLRHLLLSMELLDRGGGGGGGPAAVEGVVLHGQARTGPPPDQETSSVQVNTKSRISLV